MPNPNILPPVTLTENEHRTPASQWYDQSKGDLQFAVKSIITNELTQDEPNVRVDRFIDKDRVPHVSFSVDLPAVDGTPMSIMFQTYDIYTKGRDNQATVNSFKEDVLKGENVIPTEMRIDTDKEITEGPHTGEHAYDTRVMYWQNPHVGNSLQEELRMIDDSKRKEILIEKQSRIKQDPQSEVMFNQSLRKYLTTTFGFEE